MTTRKTKPKVEPYEGNMAIIKFGYGDEIVLPYENALTVMTALEKAEKFEDKYEEGKTISCMGYRDIHMTLLSIEEYRKIKMNQLLGIKND